MIKMIKYNKVSGGRFSNDIVAFVTGDDDRNKGLLKF